MATTDAVTIHHDPRDVPRDPVAPLELITPGTANPEEKTEIRFRGRVLSLTGKVLRTFLLASNFVLLIFSLGVLIGAGYNSTAHVFELVDTWFTMALVLGFFLLCLSLLGTLGAMSQSRILLWMYLLLLFLLGLIDLIASSYALSMARDGAAFLTKAWDVSPSTIKISIQKTFLCCGLNTYLDEWAIVPCPTGSGSANATYTPSPIGNATGRACLPPMLDEFNRYSTGVPIVGLILCFMMWGVVILTWQLIRAIANSIRESYFENVH